VSASTRRSSLCPPRHLRGSASVTPHDDPERLRWLIRRIADDDHDAFAELFDRCSGLVSRLLDRQVSDRNRAAGVLAGTFVEVWWLAGCRVAPETDVMAWIDKIVQRRVADSRPSVPASANPAPPSLNSLDAPWTQGVEVELAGLLRRRNSLPETRPREQKPGC
jgi:hypothetical protein